MPFFLAVPAREIAGIGWVLPGISGDGWLQVYERDAYTAVTKNQIANR